MSFIVEWWESMGYALKIFYAIALVSTTALLGQMVLMLFGLDDGDAHLDTDMPDVDTGGGSTYFPSERSSPFWSDLDGRESSHSKESGRPSG